MSLELKKRLLLAAALLVAGLLPACDSVKRMDASARSGKGTGPAAVTYAPFTETKALGQLPAGVGLPVGSSLPLASAQDTNGKTVALQSLLGKEHLLLVFYRGAWCPYCNFQLRELQRHVQDFKKLGVSIVAVSVDQPSASKRMAEQAALPFPLLADPELQVHRAFKVINRLSDDQIDKLMDKNKNINSYSGQTHQTVAVPAVFLISPQGRIEFAHAEEDYKSRPTAAQLLTKLSQVIKHVRAIKIGSTAVDFELASSNGESVRLSKFRGKTVVLEWFNPECPYVRGSHEEGSLKGLGAELSKKGSVVWLGINSGAKGRQGHGAEATNKGRKAFGISYPVLLDETGDIGELYGADRTPQMMIVDAGGTLVYRGAIDNSPDATGDSPEGGKLVNYVTRALGELAAGKRVSIPTSEAYGCSVKYAK